MNASLSALPPLSSPLHRKPVARAVTAVLVGLLLLSSLILCAAVHGLGSEATRVFYSALAMSSVLSLLPLAILWFLDRRERESPWFFAAAFLWGGLIATALSLPFNTAAIFAIAQWLGENEGLRDMLGPEAALLIGAPIAAPLVEETAKGLGVLALFWLARSDFDNARDGFVYGALVGAGFNWFESALYVQQDFAQFGFAPYGFQLGARYAWLGLATHVMFSGIFGASLGYARASRRPLLRWLAPPAGLGVAILAHAWNNSLPLFMVLAGERAGEPAPTTVPPPPDLTLFEAMWSASVTNLIVFLPFVLLLVWIIRRSGHAEREVIRHELESEIGGAVTPDEYRAIVKDRVWRTRRIDTHHRATSCALVNAQNELAFRKRRLRDRGHDPEADLIVGARRVQIAALRRQLGV
jgi:RsiW-degrading membrane proteinase PrsW (M82 family)